MSRWRPEALALGLDGHTLAMAGEVLAISPAGWTVPALRHALAGARQRPGGARAARVLVAPDLCRHFVMAAPGGLQSLRELQHLAALRASQLFGGPADGWTVAAEWRLEGPFACAVLPSDVTTALQAAAGGVGLALSLESAVIAALAAAAPREPGFVAWAMPCHGVVAHVGEGTVQTLRCLRRQAGLDDADRSWALQEAAQESLRSGLPCAAPQWLGGVGRLPSPALNEAAAAWASRLAAQCGR